MKKLVAWNDEIYAARQRLAAAKHLSPAEVIAARVGDGGPSLGGDQLPCYLLGSAFPAAADPTERYLALLAWCATNYATDFADFISHQESGRHYLMFHREEFDAIRARNQARQIDGTPFWAVMTIDDAARRRFVCRLLEFIGCHDETIGQACRALGFAAPSGFRQRSA